MTTLLALLVGLVVGSLFPNQIRPRVARAWQAVKSWFDANKMSDEEARRKDGA